MHTGSSCKLPVILVRFQWNLNFLNRCRKYAQISNFIKSFPVGAELFYAIGRTDRQTERQATEKKLIAFFRNFVKAPTKMEHVVAQSVEALRYKPEGRGFDSRRCYWNFSLTLSFRGRTMALGLTQPLTEMSARNTSWGLKAAGA